MRSKRSSTRGPCTSSTHTRDSVSTTLRREHKREEADLRRSDRRPRRSCGGLLLEQGRVVDVVDERGERQALDRRRVDRRRGEVVPGCPRRLQEALSERERVV